jgi:zinc/manganese transport system substrate-binding protein
MIARFFSMLALFFSLFFAPVPYGAQKDLSVVVSVPYLADVLENITCGGNGIVIRSLIVSGMDPHTYVMTPQDRLAVQSAQMVVQVGAHLEPWLDRIASPSNQTRIRLSERVSFASLGANTALKQKGFETDPHIWQSPEITKKVVLLLSQELMSLQKSDAKKIQMCTAHYVKNIDARVKEVEDIFSTLPQSHRTLATNHDALGYFATAFHFRVLTLLGLSDEDAPSVSDLNRFMIELKKQQVSAVFLESTGNRKNIQTLVENAHVTLGGILYGDSFGPKGSGAENTLDMWKANAFTIEKALR